MASCNAFYKLEKDLVPLIEMDLEVSYHIKENSREYDEINRGCQIITEYLEKLYAEPHEILENFKKYSFLMEKTAKEVTKGLYGPETETA